MLQSNTRSKDLKIQEMQSCILEAVGAISKVSNTSEVKNRKKKIKYYHPSSKYKHNRS